MSIWWTEGDRCDIMIINIASFNEFRVNIRSEAI
jgi:hypothetical protein